MCTCRFRRRVDEQGSAAAGGEGVRARACSAGDGDGEGSLSASATLIVPVATPVLAAGDDGADKMIRARCWWAVG